MTLAALAAAAAPGPALADERAAATLGIDTDPEAHVYVRGPGGKRLAALCTGQCNVRLAPGTYALAAGYSHAHLREVRDPLRLAPGEALDLRVDVKANVGSERLMLASVLTMLAGMVAIGVGYAQQGHLDRPPTNAAAVGGMIAIGVGLVGGGLAIPGLERPSVDVRRWTVPVKEDGT